MVDWLKTTRWEVCWVTGWALHNWGSLCSPPAPLRLCQSLVHTTIAVTDLLPAQNGADWPVVIQTCWKVFSGRKSSWPLEWVNGEKATDPLWVNEHFVIEPPENLFASLHTTQKESSHLPPSLSSAPGLCKWFTSNDSKRLHCKKNYKREHAISNVIKLFYLLSLLWGPFSQKTILEPPYLLNKANILLYKHELMNL